MRHSLGHTRGYRTRIYGELSQPRGLARRSRDHNTMFYRVLLGIRIIILLEISCDSRDSRQDSKDSGKIRARFEDSKEIPGAVDVIPNRVEPLAQNLVLFSLKLR